MKHRVASTACRTCALLLLFFCVGARAQYAANLRPDSLLDGWMYRIASRYGVALPASFYTQPMNTLEVEQFFAHADSLDALGVLSAQESWRLGRFRRRMQGATTPVRWENHDKDLSVQVHAAARTDFAPRLWSSRGGALDFQGVLTPSLSGHTASLSYHSDADILFLAGTDTMFYSDPDPHPYKGLHFFLFDRADSGRVISTDLLRAGVRRHGELLQFEAALDYLRQGPALFNPLFFSGQTPPVLYARARLNMGQAWYSHGAGKLQSQKWTDKYFYAHRLEVQLPRLQAMISINESIITGTTTNEQDSLSENGLRREYYGEERGWAPIYFIPFIPFILAERYERDRDNLAMSIDFSKRMWDHTRVYFEFFIDDMTIIKWPPLIGDDWGNKFALTIGHQYFGSLAGRDFESVLEYSRIEPWVYTHFYGGSHRYSHFGQSLGSSLGPNADQVTVRLLYGVTPAQRLGVSFSHARANPTARGGDISHVFQEQTTIFERDGEVVVVEPDSWTKTFLGPGTVKTTRAGVSWYGEPLDVLSAGAGVTMTFSPRLQLAGTISLDLRF